MNIDITIKNYRCFQKPARITIGEGFMAFVGVNNSGKSSLLKFFYEFRRLFDQLAGIGRIVEALIGHRQSVNPLGVQDPQELFNNTNNRDIEIEFCFNQANLSAPAPAKLAITIYRSGITWDAKLYFHDQLSNSTQLLRYNDPGDPSTSNLQAENATTIVYRGNTRLDFTDALTVFQSLFKTIYIGAFRNVLNTGTKANYFDIQVGEAFVQNWKRLKTESGKVHNQAIIDLTSEIERIFEFDSLEINPAENDTTLQLIINKKSYRLSELGSGIAQFILVLANAAIERPAYILIDEPELNLHPSLQLDFLTTLSSYASKGTLYATHSIGLARSNTEKIYSVRKINEGDSEVRLYEATPNLTQFVGELSFSSYQEFGFDKILLVEGRTEVKALQQFLRFWQKEHKILIIPLGGNQLINGSSEHELRELQRITQNISVLIDSERDSAGAPLSSSRQAFVDICTEIGMNCHVLDRRATENYFTDQAVKNAFGQNYNALGSYDKIENLSPGWAKGENWRIARRMSLDDLEGTDLGNFLRDL